RQRASQTEIRPPFGAAEQERVAAAIKKHRVVMNPQMPEAWRDTPDTLIVDAAEGVVREGNGMRQRRLLVADSASHGCAIDELTLDRGVAYAEESLASSVGLYVASGALKLCDASGGVEASEGAFIHRHGSAEYELTSLDPRTVVLRFCVH
ncbi:MAG: hypothetical protein AAFN70_11740, partial [Planctomycetota bacterium]